MPEIVKDNSKQITAIDAKLTQLTTKPVDYVNAKVAKIDNTLATLDKKSAMHKYLTGIKGVITERTQLFVEAETKRLTDTKAKLTAVIKPIDAVKEIK